MRRSTEQQSGHFEGLDSSPEAENRAAGTPTRPMLGSAGSGDEQEQRKERTVPTSFRLSQRAHAKLSAQAAEAGLSTRAWLEQAVLENSSAIVSKPKLHPDLRELLYQVNRAGTNVNRLASHFHSLTPSGGMRSSDLAIALIELTRISQSLQEALDRAR